METKSSGFTLIELLVVVAILGIIAAIGISGRESRDVDSDGCYCCSKWRGILHSNAACGN